MQMCIIESRSMAETPLYPNYNKPTTRGSAQKSALEYNFG